MKSDIIYKIGTAEFRKRYIDPAIKSGKITYDYKLRCGSLNDSLDNIKDAIIDLDTVGPGEAIITIENQ